MEEEIKNWLKKKVEESSKKGESKSPIELEKHKIGIPIKEKKLEIFTQPKVEKLEIPRKEIIPPKLFPAIQKEREIPAPEKIKLEERPAEIRKSGNTNKILIGIVLILGIAIFVIYFATFKPTFEKHEYKIFVTHNENPVEVGDKGLAYSNFEYSITVFNKTSYCGITGSSNTVTSNNYVFDSNTTVNEKTLRDYEKEGYAFVVSLFAKSSDITTDVYAATSSADFSNASLNNYELPKLSNDFSINFDVPMFNKSSYRNAVSGKNLTFHIELLDDWNKNSTFYCIASREYNPTVDSNLPDCSIQSNQSFLNVNKHCLSRFFLECNVQMPPVQYITYAMKNSGNINCSFPLNELTSGKKYSISIYIPELINPNHYKFYEAFLGDTPVT